MKEAGERGLEREPEVGSGKLAVISAVDSIAEPDDLSFPLLESGNSRGKKEGLIRFTVVRREGMDCHVIDCLLVPLVSELIHLCGTGMLVS